MKTAALSSATSRCASACESSSFDGYAVGIQAKSVAHINRYVVVGAPAFAKVMINLSGVIMPVETKTFDLADVAAAWTWLAHAKTA